jgi:hypothetical protein
MSEKDKNVSESVKTAGGTIEDPFSTRPPHPNPKAERLDEQIHTRFQPTATKWRNASETMSSYLTLIAFMLFTISPVLVPLMISAIHNISDLRRKPAPFRQVINSERRSPDMV